jgi:hypothetical protein
MQAKQRKITSGALAIGLFVGLASIAAPSMANDHTAACNAIEQVLEDLYQVPYGTEDFEKIRALELKAKVLDCDFMIL